MANPFPAESGVWREVLNIVGCFENAEMALRGAVIFMLNETLERHDSVLLDSIHDAVIGRLDMEAGVSQQVREMIRIRQAFP